jgi:hypothetical protein
VSEIIKNKISTIPYIKCVYGYLEIAYCHPTSISIYYNVEYYDLPRVGITSITEGFIMTANSIDKAQFYKVKTKEEEWEQCVSKEMDTHIKVKPLIRNIQMKGDKTISEISKAFTNYYKYINDIGMGENLQLLDTFSN